MQNGTTNYSRVFETGNLNSSVSQTGLSHNSLVTQNGNSNGSVVMQSN
jgi:hypothetical protein